MIYLFVFFLISVLVFLFSLYQNFSQHRQFTETPFLSWLGIFVWGDAIIFAPFWMISSLLCLTAKNLNLFLFITSLFWVVRSLGETIYWFNQQFSTLNRNPPERLFGYRFIKNDSIWFIYQNFWQCLTIISVLCAIFIYGKTF
ncbi:MAG TPA: hypothetical protein PK639_00410 [Candidatus Woesebacteria bacterium]|nr:hypothetical protein [Candidatus Woesebacteria bacterium]